MCKKVYKMYKLKTKRLIWISSKHNIVVIFNAKFSLQVSRSTSIIILILKYNIGKYFQYFCLMVFLGTKEVIKIYFTNTLLKIPLFFYKFLRMENNIEIKGNNWTKYLQWKKKKIIINKRFLWKFYYSLHIQQIIIFMKKSLYTIEFTPSLKMYNRNL